MTKSSAESLKRLRARTCAARGRNYFNAGRYEEALAACQESITEDPDFSDGYLGTATTLAILGRFDEAVAITGRLIAREPNNAAAHTTMGTILHRRGDAAGALPYYQQGVALCDGADFLPYYDFACYWALEGNEEECARYLGEALRRKPRMNTRAATDPDFESVRGQTWFQELVAFKKR